LHNYLPGHPREWAWPARSSGSRMKVSRLDEGRGLRTRHNGDAHVSTHEKLRAIYGLRMFDLCTFKAWKLHTVIEVHSTRLYSEGPSYSRVLANNDKNRHMSLFGVLKTERQAS
jgi:hypothetical protein